MKTKTKAGMRDLKKRTTATLVREQINALCIDMEITRAELLDILGAPEINQEALNDRYEATLEEFWPYSDGFFGCGNLSPNGAVGRCLWYRVHILAIAQAAQDAGRLPQELTGSIAEAMEAACIGERDREVTLNDVQAELTQDLERFLAEKPA